MVSWLRIHLSTRYCMGVGVGGVWGGFGGEVLGGMLGDMGDGGGGLSIRSSLLSSRLSVVYVFITIHRTLYPPRNRSPSVPSVAKKRGEKGGVGVGRVGNFWRWRGPGAYRALGGYRPPSSLR